jgi:hypothetical protein
MCVKSNNSRLFPFPTFLALALATMFRSSSGKQLTSRPDILGKFRTDESPNQRYDLDHSCYCWACIKSREVCIVCVCAQHPLVPSDVGHSWCDKEMWMW